MTDGDSVPRRSIVLLVLAGLAGAGTALVVPAFLAEYGTTTGSRLEGATSALTTGFVPLLVALALAGVALVTGRRSARLRLASLVVAFLSVAGLLAGGAQAATSKYHRLPAVPTCDGQGFAKPVKAMLARVEDAAADLEHPDRFSGGGSTGYDGCTDHLLNLTFAEAAAHYRRELAVRGWAITSDGPSLLGARRDDLVFTLSRGRHGELPLHIGPTPAAARRILEQGAGNR